jgi:pyruvate kinase
MAKQSKSCINKKRTKIICTIGPSSSGVSTLGAMMRAGMDVARLNLSHSTHKDHARLIRAIRLAAKSHGKFVPIIGDLQGPKIRLGKLPEVGVELISKSTIKLSTSAVAVKHGAMPVTYKSLHKDLKIGDRIFIDDGLIELKVVKIFGQDIFASVVNGGRVSSNKGMNFPDSTLSVGALTKKDREDVLFGIKKEIEWFALSFVTKPEDVAKLKEIVALSTPKNKPRALVVVKIEKHEAVDRLDEILKQADAVMVARGDLGVEISAQEVPIRQKEIVEKCRVAGKPVIVATQMLDSMIRNPRPTRAEVSDVANAVFDHADAVMLSGETANGKYPLNAVRTMANIVVEAESSQYDNVEPSDPIARLADEGAIDGIVALSVNAPESEMVMRNRPEVPYYLFCANEQQARAEGLRWGLSALVMRGRKRGNFEKDAITMLRKKKLIKKGSRLAIITGKDFKIMTVK